MVQKGLYLDLSNELLDYALVFKELWYFFHRTEEVGPDMPCKKHSSELTFSQGFDDLEIIERNFVKKVFFGLQELTFAILY